MDRTVVMLEDNWKFLIKLLRQCKEAQTATIGGCDMTKRRIIIEIDEVVNATVYPYHLHIRMEKDGAVIAEQKGLLFASMIYRMILTWMRDNQSKINIGK